MHSQTKEGSQSLSYSVLFILKHASKPWITNDLKELVAERDYALRVAKRSGNQEQWNEYRRLKNFTNRKIKSAEALHYKNLIESAENPKDMWRSLNSVIGSNKQGGSPFQVHDGKRLVSEPKSVATKFNKFFAAIGSKVAGQLNPVSKDVWKKYETVKEANKQSDIESTWDLQRVEQKTVQRILHSLKVNRAAGLDNIPARLLKDAEMELAPSITYLVNKSISDGIVPDLWKVARVTHLHKPDDKLQVENYRPISVLPVLSKVVERVVHSQLNAHLHQLDFLYQHQYGFRRGHSTEQAITQLNNWVLESMDEGKVTGLLFIDISKAFDSLNHKVLLRKLEHLGLSERSLRWFRSYRADRQQSVLINGELSEPHTITLGVPQGSILGPLLFEDFELQSNGTQIDRVQSFKYLGVTMDSKWSWKPHISNLLKKLGHRLSLFNRIFHMLDNRTRIAFYNGLVLPHLDYADTVWGDQPGLKSEMEKLQSFQNKFAKKIKLGKMSSSEALKCLNWLPLAGRRLSHRCTAVENAIKGDIPQHFESFKSTLRSSHGYNTRHGYLPRLPKPKT